MKHDEPKCTHDLTPIAYFNGYDDVPLIVYLCSECEQYIVHAGRALTNQD